MPMQYKRSDAKRVVVITLEGVLPTTEELLMLFERHGTEDVWHYAMLYDLRLMTGRPSFDYLREIMGKIGSLVPSSRPRGPVALLTLDPIIYSACCAYVALRRSKQKLQVFRDLDEANTWLAEQATGAN